MFKMLTQTRLQKKRAKTGRRISAPPGETGKEPCLFMFCLSIHFNGKPCDIAPDHVVCVIACHCAYEAARTVRAHVQGTHIAFLTRSH